MKIKRVLCDRVREFDGLVFLLSKGKLVYKCSKGKEHTCLISGGVVYKEGR